MGICIHSKNFPIEMDMGYGTFFNMRMDICYHLGIFKKEDESLNIRYSYDKEIYKALRKKKITKGTYNFLLAPDAEHKLSPDSCKGLLSDISDLTSPYMYGYIWTKYNRFEDFRQILRHCIRERKYLIWR